MSYIDPLTVIAPRASIQSIAVLYNTGPGGWSVAGVVWENAQRVGIRWNGAATGPGVGNPQSRGNATWFIIPEELEQVVLDKIEELSIGGPGGLKERYAEMANDEEREREAEEWSEGLIGDATAQG
jgi:hypothetical protein